MSDELPEGWVVAPLGSLLEPGGLFDGPFGSSLKTSDYAQSGVRVIRLENLANLRFVADKKTFISHAKYAELMKHTVQEGDLLVGSFIDGATRVCVLPRLDTLAIAKADCFCVRPRRDFIDPRFLAYQLGASRTHDALIEEIHGATRPRITTKQLRDFNILVCPTSEQQRIVAKVEALLARVNVARQRVAKVPAILKRFRQSVLAAACSGRLTADWRGSHDASELAKEMLRRIARNRNGTPIPEEESDAAADFPESWAYTSIGFLAEPSLRGRPFVTSGSRGWADRVAKKGPFFIRSENINTEYLRLEEAVRVDVPSGPEADRTRVQAGDLLLTITGNNVGRTAVVPADLPPAHVSQHVAIIRLTPLCSVGFLWLWLRSEKHGQGQLRSHFYGYTKPGLNLDQVKAVWVYFPPIEEQHEIVRRVEALFRLADAIEKRVAAATARAEKLTQAILAKAFRGELVPTEAELARREGRDYEPASVLLERIRAERAKSSSSTTNPKKQRTKTRQ